MKSWRVLAMVLLMFFMVGLAVTPSLAKKDKQAKQAAKQQKQAEKAQRRADKERTKEDDRERNRDGAGKGNQGQGWDGTEIRGKRTKGGDGNNDSVQSNGEKFNPWGKGRGKAKVGKGEPVFGKQKTQKPVKQRTHQPTIKNPNTPFKRAPEKTGGVGRPSKQDARVKEAPMVVSRGHKDPRQVQAISRNAHERSSKEIRGNVRNWNRGEKTFDRSRLPKGTIFIDREKNRHIRARSEKVFGRLGVHPSNRFDFIPRTRFDGDFFGHRDGHRDFRRYNQHVTVVLDFGYPHYYSDPAWYGFYHPGYYPSVYAMWGWCPGWIPPSRAYYEPNDYFYRGSYYGSLDYRGMEQAIADINDAWINGDIDLINNHLTNEVDVRISFNGKYSYTLSADDYYAMTTDAMANMASCSVSFNRPAWISSYEIFVTGRQVFVDPDNEEHILYLSYRLRKLGADWYIVAFGSSNRAIPNPYR